jgi:hypothetical protein
MAVDNRIKKELFNRGVRMQHKFGDLVDRGDPIQKDTFDPMFPRSLSTRHGNELHQYQKGEHSYREDPSPVVTPSGRRASFNGPSPDVAEEIARPIPVGTKRRFGPPKTDK